MKVAENPVEVIQSGEAEKIAMGFHAESLQHLMNVLTRLYSDPVMAAIREYLTNAYDSHVEAGQTKPIEVFLPTAFRKSFVIQDYGVGLSKDDFELIYSQYGASTKRDSNDVVGMLGLGCKSALAYTNQFFVTGVKDGKEVLALVTRDSGGASAIEILSHEATDKQNGVKIEIPVDNTYDFNNKVKQFLYYWKPGLVTIDGQGYDSIYDDPDATWLADDVMIQQNKGMAAVDGNEDILIMGNVPYPMKRPEGVNLAYHYRVVHFADIGSVDFVPSREELEHTFRTNKYLEAYKQRLIDLIDEKAKELIEDADTIQEVVRAIKPFGMNVEWRGINLPTHDFRFNPDKTDDKNYMLAYHIRSGRAEKTNSRERFDYSVPNYLVITNYSPTTFGIGNFRKAYDYLTRNGDVNKPNKVLLYNTKEYPEALNDFHVVDWEEIKTWSRKNGARRGGSGVDRTEVYNMWNPTDQKWEDRATKRGEKYVIFTPARNAYTWAEFNVRKVCEVVHSDRIVVRESKNRHDKFVRENKDAIVFKLSDIKDYIDSHIGRAEATYLKYKQSGVYSELSNKVAEIDDPDLARFLKVISGKGVDEGAISCYRELSAIYRFNSFDAKPYENPLDTEYKVVQTGGWGHSADDVIEAINALYAYRKENK